MEGEARIRKLRWMCRRGMKELDVLLERFLRRHDAALRAGRWAELEAFLGEEDDRIWSMVQAADTGGDPAYRSLIRALRRGP